MQFIVTTNVRKADARTQKLIRSQAMMGKNRGKSNRDKQRKGISWAVVADITRDPPVPLDTFIETYNSAIPGRIGSDLSFVEFAAEMDSAAFGKLISCGSLLFGD